MALLLLVTGPRLLGTGGVAHFYDSVSGLWKHSGMNNDELLREDSCVSSCYAATAAWTPRMTRLSFHSEPGARTPGGKEVQP